MAENLRAGDASNLGHDQASRADPLQTEQEDLWFRAWFLGGGLSISSRTTPGSVVGTAMATVLLAAAGCACAVVLSAVSAPPFAVVAGLVLPVLVFSGLRRLSRARRDGQAQDSPSDTLPGNVRVPQPRRPTELPAKDAE